MTNKDLDLLIVEPPKEKSREDELKDIMRQYNELNKRLDDLLRKIRSRKGMN